MFKKFFAGALLSVMMLGNAIAAPVLYNFDFETNIGSVVGTFVADFEDGQNAPVSSFLFNFAGVTFDLGAVVARDSGSTDFTGLSTAAVFGGSQVLTSSSTADATLFLDTCGSVACAATWTNIPNFVDGNFNETQPNAVSRAQQVASPSALLLSLIGLALILVRRANKS